MHPGSQSELRVLLAFVLLLMYGQAYDPAALLVKLKAISVENGTLAEVEQELRSVCVKEGITLVVAKSSRVGDGSSNRVDVKKIVCQRAAKGTRDQEQYLLSLDNGNRMPGAGAVFAGHVYILEYFVVRKECSETSRIKRDARGVHKLTPAGSVANVIFVLTDHRLPSLLCCLLCAVRGITRRNG